MSKPTYEVLATHHGYKVRVHAGIRHWYKSSFIFRFMAIWWAKRLIRRIEREVYGNE